MNPSPPTYADLWAQSADVLEYLCAHGAKLALAESCTGGLVSSLMTTHPGASHVLECSYVTYSNAAKEQMLGVSSSILETYGAVSHQTALAMAEGALNHMPSATCALSITGIAGPSSPHTQKPVGTVYMALAKRNQSIETAHHLFPHDAKRTEIQYFAAQHALAWLQEVE